MDLRQLRYLVALAEEGSFTRAAASEHIAQPAVSQQIRRLEDELGLALVERTTRRVRLTDAGELLVVRARRIMAELDSAEIELQALRGMQGGHVTIGAMHTMGPVDLTLALALFSERHPQVQFTVREQSSEEMAEMLRVDELDLAFLSVTERVESHGLGLYQLVSEELVVLLPREHRLAKRRPGGPPPARAAALGRTRVRVRAAGHTRVKREPADQTVGVEGARSRDPAPLGCRGLRSRGRGREADRAQADPRHHARVARRAPPCPGGGRVSRARARDVRPPGQAADGRALRRSDSRSSVAREASETVHLNPKSSESTPSARPGGPNTPNTGIQPRWV